MDLCLQRVAPLLHGHGLQDAREHVGALVGGAVGEAQVVQQDLARHQVHVLGAVAEALEHQSGGEQWREEVVVENSYSISESI